MDALSEVIMHRIRAWLVVLLNAIPILWAAGGSPGRAGLCLMNGPLIVCVSL